MITLKELMEAKKKVGEYSHTNGNVTKVYKNTGEHYEGDPYTVKLFKNGKHYEPSDYFTNDLEDAHGTAKHMVKESNEEVYNEDIEEGLVGNVINSVKSTFSGSTQRAMPKHDIMRTSAESELAKRIAATKAKLPAKKITSRPIPKNSIDRTSAEHMAAMASEEISSQDSTDISEVIANVVQGMRTGQVQREFETHVARSKAQAPSAPDHEHHAKALIAAVGTSAAKNLRVTGGGRVIPNGALNADKEIEGDFNMIDENWQHDEALGSFTDSGGGDIRVFRHGSIIITKHYIKGKLQGVMHHANGKSTKIKNSINASTEYDNNKEIFLERIEYILSEKESPKKKSLEYGEKDINDFEKEELKKGSKSIGKVIKDDIEFDVTKNSFLFTAKMVDENGNEVEGTAPTSNGAIASALRVYENMKSLGSISNPNSLPSKKSNVAKIAKIAKHITKPYKPGQYSPKNPKINLYVNGVYHSSTNWSPTVRHAISGFKDKYPAHSDKKVTAMKATQ